MPLIDGERTCIADLGANKNYPIEHMKDILQMPEFKTCHLYYTTGFFMNS